MAKPFQSMKSLPPVTCLATRQDVAQLREATDECRAVVDTFLRVLEADEPHLLPHPVPRHAAEARRFLASLCALVREVLDTARIVDATPAEVATMRARIAQQARDTPKGPDL